MRLCLLYFELARRRLDQVCISLEGVRLLSTVSPAQFASDSISLVSSTHLSSTSLYFTVPHTKMQNPKILRYSLD
ncbi:unnamed protein product [Cylicocyclus nassatus]|uniref:Uncharacterized protein n=1 Tax=Cylicocyclus nassatus TaxID=53992 RepID=A0AA36H2T3_CYLNA|nr:unnamed protein product [Cylicocyclus nassatus]